MLTFSSIQNVSSAQDVQGSRAYQAARTGAEWGVYQLLQLDGGAFATACRTPGGTASLLPVAISGFAINVQCTATSYTEDLHTAASPLWVYQIVSTATSGTLGRTDYVDRQVRLRIERQL
ncbi:hypothetical protein BH11PSE11_BH11PSE11_11370 [soil metagenome]